MRPFDLYYYQGRSYDIDAQAHFIRAGTLPQYKPGINKYALALKNAGIWSKMRRIWIFDPSSESSSTYCLKTGNQFTYVDFGGTGGWSTLGVEMDPIDFGGHCLADGNFNPFTDGTISVTNMGVAVVSNLDTNIANLTSSSPMGGTSAPTARYEGMIFQGGTATARGRMPTTTNSHNAAVTGIGSALDCNLEVTNFTGSWFSERTALTAQTLYRNGCNLNTGVTSTTGTLANTSVIGIGASYAVGALNTVYYGRLCLVAYGEALGGTLGPIFTNLNRQLQADLGVPGRYI